MNVDNNNLDSNDQSFSERAPPFVPLPLYLLKVVLGDVSASPMCQPVEPGAVA